MLSGASVRYRFYTRWGVTAEELSRDRLLVLGHVLAGPARARRPQPRPQPAARRSRLDGIVAPVGWCLVGLERRLHRRHRGSSRAAARGPLRAAAAVDPHRGRAARVSVIDWALAGAVLYVLLPPNGAPFLAVLGAFLAAQLLGLASHVPGGVGVFEGLMVLLLRPFFTVLHVGAVAAGARRLSRRVLPAAACASRSWPWSPTKSGSGGPMWRASTALPRSSCRSS